MELNNGDLIVTKDKREFLVIRVIPSINKHIYNQEGEVSEVVNYPSEVHLFNVSTKKPTLCSYDRVQTEGLLWVDVEIDKVIKSNDYLLKIEKNI